MKIANYNFMKNRPWYLTFAEPRAVHLWPGPVQRWAHYLCQVRVSVWVLFLWRCHRYCLLLRTLRLRMWNCAQSIVSTRRWVRGRRCWMSDLHRRRRMLPSCSYCQAGKWEITGNVWTTDRRQSRNRYKWYFAYLHVEYIWMINDDLKNKCI